MNIITRALMRIGLVRWYGSTTDPKFRELRGPFDFGDRAGWRMSWTMRNHPRFGWCGIFDNDPRVVRKQPGSWLPRRWGFFFLGFEFGHRGGGHGDALPDPTKIRYDEDAREWVEVVS